MDRQAASLISPPPPATRCDLSVVAIGASAGGVAALSTVLSALPLGFPAVVIALLHQAPRHRSVLAALLGRTCHLPVSQAESGEVVRIAHVYVAPPSAHLVLSGGALTLTDTALVHFVRPSVDVLFRSVAAACGPRAVGVILTGAGVDGADGLRAIKEARGRTIVQEPESAEHAGMPSAAYATGCADFILPLTSIGSAIVALILTPATAPATEGSR